MKWKLLLLCAFGAVGAASVFWACRKELRDEAAAPEDLLTVEQARAFFENSVAPTKAGGYLSSAGGPGGDLNPGDFTPHWDKAHRAALDYQVDGVDVEIDADYTYSAVFVETTPGGDTVRRRVDIAQKLVVNRWRNHPRWLGLYAYIATIVPTPDYYDRHKNFGRTFVNLGDKDGFSGFVIYHDLNGFFVNADRYDDGEMTAQAYDEGNDAADRYAAAQLLGDTELYGNGPSLYSLHIEAPEVTATACQTCKMQNCQCKMNGALPCECLGSETEQQKDTTKKDPKPQGGGGGPTTDKDDGKKQLPIIESDNDCADGYTQNLSGARNTLNHAITAKTREGESGQWNTFLKESDGKGVEYGLSMHRISQGQTIIYGFMPMAIGTANDVDIAHYPAAGGGITQTIASIHTHTNGLPPSGLDVLRLVNEQTRTEYNDVYVITGSGSSRTVYVLHVEDRGMMTSSRGLVDADPNTHAFTSGSMAGHHYEEAMSRFEGSRYSEADRQAYSLAYALEKCNTGIRLLRGSLTANGSNVQFSQMQMILDANATKLTKCQ